jgi:hypothetical protein
LTAKADDCPGRVSTSGRAGQSSHQPTARGPSSGPEQIQRFPALQVLARACRLHACDAWIGWGDERRRRRVLLLGSNCRFPLWSDTTVPNSCARSPLPSRITMPVALARRRSVGCQTGGGPPLERGAGGKPHTLQWQPRLFDSRAGRPIERAGRPLHPDVS